MYFKVRITGFVGKAIDYNEKKCERGVARLISANGFLQDMKDLKVADKKLRFARLAEKTPSVKKNGLHISLSLSERETIIADKLVQIVADYMSRIGFGDQPYLVYRHMDTSHPHVHIVSTNLLPTGMQLSWSFLVRDKSEPARKAIEAEYGLTSAKQEKKRRTTGISAEKIRYGSAETIRSMEDVLEFVLKFYRFTSLTEFNAILYTYNLLADPGKPGGIVHRNNGLIYQTLDENGQPIGNRIKSSLLSLKPGVSMLTAKFKENADQQALTLPHLRTAIDLVLRSAPTNWRQLTDRLRKEQIQVIPYINRQKELYNIAFVDHRNRVGVTGGSLGNRYTAGVLLGMLGLDQYLRPGRFDHSIEAYIPGDHQMSLDFARAIKILGEGDELPDLSLEKKLANKRNKKRPPRL